MLWNNIPLFYNQFFLYGCCKRRLDCFSVLFFVDSVNPVVNIIYPSDSSSLGINTSVALNFSVIDANRQSCWYRIDSGINISIATPKGYEPNNNIVKESKKFIEVELLHDPFSAVKNADVVVTDTFVSIHHQATDRAKDFLPKFQVNPSLMKKAEHDAIFLHCLPAKRGQEVTSSVLDGSQSVVWDEAENRLHAQKSLMIALLRV